MTDAQYATIFQDIVAAAAARGFGPASYPVTKALDVLDRARFEAETRELSFREGFSK